jgi:hypothetical protein
MYLFQGLEGQDLQRIAKGTSAAQQLTLSFWVKSNVTGTYVVNLQDTDNTRVVSSAYTISASATWEKKTITFAADTTGAFDNDNAGSLYLNFWLGAGSTYTSGTLRSAWTATANGDYAVGQTNLAAATNNYWQVTGVQLEVGPNPTPFEFKSFNQELRECQRYHYRITGDTYARYGSGFNNTTTTGQGVVFLPVTMRAAPSSITTTGTASNYAVFHGAGTITACSAVPTLGATGVTSTTVTLVFTVASGLTAGGACQIISNNNASAFIGFNAEL